jgi:hypothetical protein
MSEPQEIDYLKPFIEATIAASSRFRRVLIVVIIASILGFGAFWNARRGSWVDSRIRFVHQAYDYLDLKIKKDQLLEQVDTKSRELKEAENKLTTTSDEKEKIDITKRKEVLTTENAALSEKIKNLEDNLSKNYVNAAKWINERGITSKDQLGPIIQRWENARVEYVALVRIPFFGIVFDVNDLGLLGGFTFVVVLMWFRFSLWREYNNLRTTFREVKSEHLKICYMTLAMNQVLTVPPALSQNQPREKPWGTVVRLLYFLPVIIQLTIFLYDCYSFEDGRLVNEFNTIFGISVSLCFLVLSGMLTYWCYHLSDEIDKEWDKAFDKLQKQSDGAPNNSFNRSAG